MKTYHITSGILRQGDTLLMIQQGAMGETPYWFIPGGMVEHGELLEVALKREFQEETGVTVLDIGKLAYMVQVINETHQSMVYVFDVISHTGEISPNDPDDLIHDAQFMPIQDAIHALNGVLWLSMKQPLLAYLQSHVSAGAVWQYRQYDGANFELISRLPSSK
jgi:ADP-ribose pyrophosphatase YjhB (NUDIX family)